MVNNGRIAIEFHHPEMIVGTHGTHGSHYGILMFRTSIGENLGVALGDTLHATTDHAGAPIIKGERMDGSVDGTSIVIIVADGVAYAHYLVSLIYNRFVEVAAEPAVEITVTAVEFSGNQSRRT